MCPILMLIIWEYYGFSRLHVFAARFCCSSKLTPSTWCLLGISWMFELPPRLTLYSERRSTDKQERNKGVKEPRKGESCFPLSWCLLWAFLLPHNAEVDVAYLRCAGVPWTSSEHLAFLQGLKALGKGNW